MEDQKATDPDLLLDIPAELSRLRAKYEVTGDLSLDEYRRYARLSAKLRMLNESPRERHGDGL